MRLGRMMLWMALLAMALAAGGCGNGSLGMSSQRLHEKLQSGDPSERMCGVVVAGERADAESVPYLVHLLEDPEEHVRIAAILALRKITGTDRGYQYYGPPTDRAEAVGRWRGWLDRRATTRPATQPAEVRP
ncbi:MAG TPA: HEAT repeat domain-containing protein [Phycisphaerae bacterium]|nr:HEAT repeat domain-containing protein [Phycisphaerae bacterium]